MIVSHKKWKCTLSCESEVLSYTRVKAASAASDLWIIAALFILALIALNPKETTKFPIVSLINVLMSTLFDKRKASVSDVPTCVFISKYCLSSILLSVTTEQELSGTLGCPIMANFKAMQIVPAQPPLLSLLSYQLSQFGVDKARLWEPPRLSRTI